MLRRLVMAPERSPQLAYSELQKETYNEPKRRTKATKIVAVLQHFLGRTDLQGLVAVDLGCSTGFTADALRSAGATVMGVDIDVPGLIHASRRFGIDLGFTCADGTALPLGDRSVDIVVFNHIYEHVVDADAVVAEIHRILREDGLVYLGLGNKRGVVEPHYRLPFLSWLPRPVAHRYVRLFQRAPSYYEEFRTRKDLLRMCSRFVLWEYTYTVLADADAFNARDMVPKQLTNAPTLMWRALQLVMPTFIWVGTLRTQPPAGRAMRQPPTMLGAPGVALPQVGRVSA